MKNNFSIEIPIMVELYDTDAMQVVWHGNYIRYYEQARTAILRELGHDYASMEKSGYAWPIVKLNSKFISPLVFGDKFKIKATLLEYENRLRISFIITNPQGKIINKGETIQMCYKISTNETLFQAPKFFIDTIREKIENS